MKNILITGGSGLIGRSLSSFLTKKGHQVSWLSRTKQSGNYNTFLWNPDNLEMHPDALDSVDVIIQLAGSNIADSRWTSGRKKEIIESRIKAIQTLHKCFKKYNFHIPHIIQASAIGIYGSRGSEILTEHSSSGNEGFLTGVCKTWETEAESLKEFSEHFSIIRTGLYLSPHGGVWSKLIQTKKFGFLVYFGEGTQYYSWIHYMDYNRAISFIINQKINGILNLTAPNPITNKELIVLIGKHSEKSLLKLGMPTPILKLILGELSESVLASDYVLPKVLMQNEFHFEVEQAETAITNLIYLDNAKETNSNHMD